MARWRTSWAGALGRLVGRGEQPGRDGDARDLEREGDPRGGFAEEGYRTAPPTDVVEEEGVPMAGPGGAPPDRGTVDERRRATEEWRRDREADRPRGA
jgi:hypothetical protein